MLASRAAVVTINGSIGGGIVGIIGSYLHNRKIFDIPIFVTGIRSGLVSVTAICIVCQPWEGLIVGMVGAAVALACADVMDRFCFDDPVNAVATHACTGVWGMIAVALFMEQELTEGFAKEYGILKGGHWRLLGVQLLACVVVIAWVAVTSFLQFYIIEKTIGLRLSLAEELLGADRLEHGIGLEDEEIHRIRRTSRAGELVDMTNLNINEEIKEVYRRASLIPQEYSTPSLRNSPTVIEDELGSLQASLNATYESIGKPKFADKAVQVFIPRSCEGTR